MSRRLRQLTAFLKLSMPVHTAAFQAWNEQSSLFYSLTKVFTLAKARRPDSLLYRLSCFIETAAIFNQKIFMKIYFTRLLLRWYERNSLSQSPKDVLWPSPPQKIDINNKFYDLISLSEPCTFFVIFPSSRAAENVFAKEVITKDVRRNRIYVRKKNQKKIFEKRNRKKWSTFGVL